MILKLTDAELHLCNQTQTLQHLLLLRYRCQLMEVSTLPAGVVLGIVGPGALERLKEASLITLVDDGHSYAIKGMEARVKAQKAHTAVLRKMRIEARNGQE